MGKRLKPTAEVERLADMFGLRACDGYRVKGGVVYRAAPPPDPLAWGCTGLPLFVYAPDGGKPEIIQGLPEPEA